MSCDVFFFLLQLLSISAQKESSEASLKAALSTAQEKSVPAIRICQLLCSVHESFPSLQPVMQELGHVGKKGPGFHPSTIFYTRRWESWAAQQWTSASWWPEVISQNRSWEDLLGDLGIQALGCAFLLLERCTMLVLYILRVVKTITDPTLNCVCVSPPQPVLWRHLSNSVT